MRYTQNVLYVVTSEIMNEECVQMEWIVINKAAMAYCFIRAEKQFNRSMNVSEL